ncbi:MAG: hypothetical protein HOV87_17575 [Catenulispora sp.]|nr:hypothetical protein [Catenulispora sp.]
MIRQAVAVVAAVAAAAVFSPSAAAGTTPTLTLSTSVAKVGERVAVTGSGFPAGARLQVEICGIGGTSNSCAIGDAVFATTDAFGGFRQNLLVTEPPTPCPCVVHAAPFAGASADPLETPLSIPGLRYLPQAAPAIAGTAKLLDATAADDSPFLTQIGAGGSAHVTLTFGNLSGGPAGDPGVVLTLSRGGSQVGRYPVAWAGGALPVGQRRTLGYEIPLPGAWFRDYEIGVVVGAGDGTAAGLGKPLTLRTLAASVRPWGELVVPGTLLLGLLCLLAGRRRRYKPADGLPVRAGAVAGRRSGVAVPEPFSAVEPATLGIVTAPPSSSTAPESGTALGLSTALESGTALEIQATEIPETVETAVNESP